MQLIDHALHTRQGDLRPFNEDDARCLQGHNIWVVADGMASADPQASSGRLAIDLLSKGVEDGLDMRSAIVKAHQDFIALGNHEMGACLVAMQVNEACAQFYWVGDCRAYALQNDALSLISKDQTQVQRWIDDGLVSEDEAPSHPYRNVLLQAVGIEQETPLLIGRAEIQIKDAARVILCSDGVSDFLSAQVLKALLSSGSCEQASRAILDEALKAGSGDDMSVIVIDLHDK